MWLAVRQKKGTIRPFSCEYLYLMISISSAKSNDVLMLERQVSGHDPQ